MVALLNLGSLILGLTAWILPVISLLKRNNSQIEKSMLRCVVSLALCTVALYFQILYSHYLVRISDWSAIMDTSSGVVFISGVLLVVTLVFDVLVVLKYSKNNRGL